MSYGAWGDGDDNDYGDLFEKHEERLLEDGWLDAEDAAYLNAELVGWRVATVLMGIVIGWLWALQ